MKWSDDKSKKAVDDLLNNLREFAERNNTLNNIVSNYSFKPTWQKRIKYKLNYFWYVIVKEFLFGKEYDED